MGTTTLTLQEVKKLQALKVVLTKKLHEAVLTHDIETVSKMSHEISLLTLTLGDIL